MIVGQFSNGGLAHKKMIECICYDGGQLALACWFTRKELNAIALMVGRLSDGRLSKCLATTKKFAIVLVVQK